MPVVIERPSIVDSGIAFTIRYEAGSTYRLGETTAAEVTIDVGGDGGRTRKSHQVSVMNHQVVHGGVVGRDHVTWDSELTFEVVEPDLSASEKLGEAAELFNARFGSASDPWDERLRSGPFAPLLKVNVDGGLTRPFAALPRVRMTVGETVTHQGPLFFVRGVHQVRYKVTLLRVEAGVAHLVFTTGLDALPPRLKARNYVVRGRLEYAVAEKRVTLMQTVSTTEARGLTSRSVRTVTISKVE